MIEKLTISAPDWSRYRACPVCKAQLGAACMSLSGSIVGGRPDGVRTVTAKPHSSRKLRKSRKVGE